MSSSPSTISKEEAIWAVKNGREHLSQLQMDVPDFFCSSPKPVKIDTMIRGIRNAASMVIDIQAEEGGRLRWFVSPKAKLDTLTWPLYSFVGQSIEHIRGALLAESETKELFAVSKRGKSGRRKSIDD